MAKREVDPVPDEIATSRLWLGYSADNLRSKDNQPEQSRAERPGLWQEHQPQTQTKTPSHGLSCRKGRLSTEYSVPDEYDNIDQLETPSPIVSSRRQRQEGDIEGRSSEETAPAQNGYTIPADFGNLAEVSALSPIASIQGEWRQGCLEDRNSEGNLTEVAAPPTADKSEELGSGGLENCDTRSASAEEIESKRGVPPSNGRESKLMTEISTISYLVFFSLLGTLARLGLQALTFYPGAPVQTGLLWANVAGSLIMGFLSEDRMLFRDGWSSPQPSERPKSNDEEKGKPRRRTPSLNRNHAAIKKTWPLYIGLATGFCGSFTSFASFMRDAFFSLSNTLPVPLSHPSSTPLSQTTDLHRSPGYSFLAVFAVLVITVGLSLSALQLGAHLALASEPITPSISFPFAHKVLDRSFFFIAWGCWLGAIVLAIWPPDRPGGPVGDNSWSQESWRSQALFALVFAPLGCLLRYYASLHLNGRIKSFPLGTFAVNIFGTALEAMFLDLQRVPIGGMVGCQVVQGLSDGFCGCLTTISTWVVELTTLRLRHAYFYGLMSVGSGLALMIIITGSLQWTDGFGDPLCRH